MEISFFIFISSCLVLFQHFLFLLYTILEIDAWNYCIWNKTFLHHYGFYMSNIFNVKVMVYIGIIVFKYINVKDESKKLILERETNIIKQGGDSDSHGHPPDPEEVVRRILSQI